MYAGRIGDGADGAIGTTYNIMPKTACEIYDSFMKGDMKQALHKQNQLNRVIDFLLRYNHNFAYWKLPLKVLGIDVGYTVKPSKLPDSDEIENVLTKLLETQFAKEIE